jgi:hypothetical protein
MITKRHAAVAAVLVLTGVPRRVLEISGFKNDD